MRCLAWRWPAGHRRAGRGRELRCRRRHRGVPGFPLRRRDTGALPRGDRGPGAAGAAGLRAPAGGADRRRLRRRRAGDRGLLRHPDLRWIQPLRCADCQTGLPDGATRDRDRRAGDRRDHAARTTARSPGARCREARARGLVTRVVADDQVATEAALSAREMAALSPQALRLNKRALRQFGRAEGSSRDQREPHYAYAPSAEHREGLAAFNEKRPARFNSAPPDQDDR